jgi:hypothetical protein
MRHSVSDLIIVSSQLSLEIRAAEGILVTNGEKTIATILLGVLSHTYPHDSPFNLIKAIAQDLGFG